MRVEQKCKQIDVNQTKINQDESSKTRLNQKSDEPTNPNQKKLPDIPTSLVQNHGGRHIFKIVKMEEGGIKM